MTVWPSSMRVLQLQRPGLLAEAVLPVPRPGVGEVLIRTAIATICTSDFYDIDHNPFGIVLPRVLGHEGAGVVAAVGPDVAGLAPGDRVAVHPVIPCGTCSNCRRGLGHLCSRMGHLGLDRDGTFAEFFCTRADRVRRVGADLDLGCAALLEPVSVCLEALARGRVERGDTVLIVGDGPFGVIMARLAVRRGNRTMLAGRHAFRLGQVPGAMAIDVEQTVNVLSAILDANGGVGVDAAVMAAGTQAALDLCLCSLRARGRAVVFSAIHGPATFDLFRLHTQELEVLGACNDEDYIDEALASLSDPELRLETVVTHRLAFAQWPEAFDLARNGKARALKVGLVFGGET